MKIKFELKREISVSREVCLWNTWDHEHLYFVHKQFTKAKILYEDSHVAFIQTKVRIPFTPFYISALHTMTSLKGGDVMVIDTMPFGVLAKLEMKYIEVEPKKTLLHNIYELELPWIFFPLKSAIPKIIKKWNDVNWEEDIPLKKRRQLAIDSGFRDFYGKTDSCLEGQNILRLPIPRTKDSILNFD